MTVELRLPTNLPWFSVCVDGRGLVFFDGTPNYPLKKILLLSVAVLPRGKQLIYKIQCYLSPPVAFSIEPMCKTCFSGLAVFIPETGFFLTGCPMSLSW